MRSPGSNKECRVGPSQHRGASPVPGRIGAVPRSARRASFEATNLLGAIDFERSRIQDADQRGIAETFHNISLTHRGKGTSAAAFDACAQAIEAAEIHGEAGLIALTLLGRAEILIESQSCAEANRDIERAEILAWSAGADAARVRARVLRGARGGGAD